MPSKTNRFGGFGGKRSWLALSVLMVALLAATIAGANGVFAGAPISSISNVSASSASSAAVSAAQAAPAAPAAPVSCADIAKLGIDRQMNAHASEILASCAGVGKNGSSGKSGSSGSSGSGLGSTGNGGKGGANPIPDVYGGTDANVILPDGTYPHVTQSEAMVWGHGNTIVVNYNDSRTAPSCYAGISVSTDGGVTFSHTGQQLCSGHGTNYGDPIVVYNAHLNAWYAGDLATGCGGQGIGIWTSPDGITWTAGACAHNNSQDDRESMWVDNNASSPYYGRMYISLGDYNVGQGALELVYSDNGTTWTGPVIVSNTSTFIRDVQITGDVNGSGEVYIAGMDEGGGGLNTRQNHMFHSTNGGASWTDVIMGPRFYPPGRGVSGYFAGMYPNGYWRHMGWGQPAAVGNVVHYAYAMGISGSDPGNIMYTRSTDSGATWSTPVQLNTDTTTRAQWQPSLTAASSGTVFVGWYDERETTTACTAGSSTPCYRRYGDVSHDNGASWQGDDAVGDVVSPLPGQPDSGVQPLYAGDYNYDSTDGVNMYDTWTDGRVIISSASQQDVFFDKVLAGPPPTNTPTVTGTPPTATRTPTITQTPTNTATPCNYATATGTATIVPGVNDIGNHTDDGGTTINLPFTYRLYNTDYTAVTLTSNGQANFGPEDTNYSNTCLPDDATDHTIFPYWDDLYTVNAGYGIYTSTSGTAPNRIFNIEWRTQYYPGTGTANFEVRLYEGQQRFDVIYGTLTNGNTSATSGVQADTVAYTQYFCNGSGGAATGSVTYTYPCSTPPTNTPTNTNTPAPTNTATHTATNTAVPTNTSVSTNTSVPTNTAVPTNTNTPGPPTETSTPCTISFTDVHPTDYFYNDVKCVYCLGAVSGYSDGTFRPFANTTRGQMTKIIVLALRIPLYTPTAGSTFNDVPRGSTFFDYVETAAHNQIVSGYSDGSFRPNALVTRGQLSKIDAIAANKILGWDLLNPTTPTFSDVPPTNPFYTYIETVSCHGVVSGYSDGTFRWTANAIRAQIAKIVCVTSQDPPAQCLSGTPQVSVTPIATGTP